MEFVDFLNQYNIPYRNEGHHHCRPGWVQIDCPFCGKGTNKWHMGYSLSGKFANCWRCGSHSLPSIISEITGIDRQSSLKIVKQLPKSINTYSPKISTQLKIPTVGPLLPAHKKYLKKRKFNIPYLQKIWNIQGIGIDASYSWRIFIPVYYQGQMTNWTTRAIRKSQVRYMSCPNSNAPTNIKDLLYGEDFVRNTIIVCEGPTDVWRIGPGAVATFGTVVSCSQMRKIAQYPVRYICFDSTPDAQRESEKLVNDMSVFDGETFNIKLDSKDAGSASINEIKLLRQLLK